MNFAIGIVLGLLVNHLIFPRHARVVFLSQTSQLLGKLSALYLELCRLVLYPYCPPSLRKTILKQELRIRRSLLVNSTALVENMRDEVSLTPKPVSTYRQVLSSQQRLLDVLTGLRRIREHLPRKAVVNEVLEERRNLIACVYLSLLACEHAFRSRRSLPQCLPSMRMALNQLNQAVERSLGMEYQANPTESGFALIFAHVEHEALTEMVTEIENLLELCRRLFGTAAWMVGTIPQNLRTDGKSQPHSVMTDWQCAIPK